MDPIAAVAKTWRLVVALAAPLLLAAAPAQTRLEVAVKAAYLPKLAPFVDWPPEALGPDGGPLVICVVGGDPFGRLIDQAARGQKVGRHPLVVRRLDRVTAASGCHIAYLGGSRGQSTADNLKALQGAPVLTVTDGVDAPEGIVHFVLDNNRVRFRINTAAAGAARLRLSSKLLSLAVTSQP